MTARHRLLVHAHCYQPPREEPWLELVPREPSAAPDHDWNVRITRECYAPLGAAPVLDAAGRVRRVVNCWEWLSFNVGPTLVHWLERNAPAVLAQMVAGDRASLRRTGHGAAIAAPYHHVILPLASRRDKQTEVRWGMREFRRTFGREPLGMWLPETAVDEETLSVLAEEGIRFTILAPHQVHSPDRGGAPLTWRRDGREVALITYDGDLSHRVAFGDLLKDAERFAKEIGDQRSEIDGVPPVSDFRSPISVVAVDGETFGHHHRFGDLGVAALIDQAGASMVGAEQLLADSPPVTEVTLVAPSSWSCPHGVERWRAECGCRMEPNTRQDWRAPLRIGLATLSAELSAIIARDWPGDAESLDKVVRNAVLPGGENVATPLVRRLLDLERHRLAMFTSCAWFFDDLARIEPRIVLRHAARALDLVAPEEAAMLERALVAILAEARANDPADGTGASIWARDIVPGRLAEPRLAAGLLALHAFEREQPITLELPAHTWTLESNHVHLTNLRTGEETRWLGEIITLGVVASRVHLRPAWGGASQVIESIDFPEALRTQLAIIAAAFVFDVTLNNTQRRALDSGELAPADARRAALEGALNVIDPSDFDVTAAPLLHGALDLYALAGVRLTLEERAIVWQRLAPLPATAGRARLADRLELALPE